MAKKIIPLYQLGEHCEVDLVGNFEIAPFTDESCTSSEFGVHHRHEYYEIIWLKKGNGVHHIDAASYVYQGPVIFLLSPGQIHRLEQKAKANGYLIRFVPTVFRDQKDVDDFVLNTFLFDNVEAHPLVKISDHHIEAIEELFSKMNTEFYIDEPDKLPVISAYLKILMTRIIRIKRSQQNVQNPTTNIQYSIFSRYKTAIEKNFSEMHAVQHYADHLNTQARTLNSLSRKYTGKSAGELIADRLVLEAKRRLLHNLDSIKEVAFLLGFQDPAYFTRFFKKHTGLSPQEYKQQNQVLLTDNMIAP